MEILLVKMVKFFINAGEVFAINQKTHLEIMESFVIKIIHFHEIKSFTVKKQEQNLLNFKTVKLKKDSPKNGQKLVGKISVVYLL